MNFSSKKYKIAFMLYEKENAREVFYAQWLSLLRFFHAYKL